MEFDGPKCIRFEDELENGKVPSVNIVHVSDDPLEDIEQHEIWMSPEKDATSQAWHEKELSSVFSEEYESSEEIVYDPRGLVISRWNKIFLFVCLISLFVDPLLFYLPRAQADMCFTVTKRVEVILTGLRSIIDIFYLVQILVRFRTAYVSPSSRVFGRGELVVDLRKISSRYLQRDFWLDLLAAIPLPQVLIWAVIPNLSGRPDMNNRNVIRFLAIVQYLVRLYLTYPLSYQIVKVTGFVTERAWSGAAYNLLLFMLASHVLGACWYLLAVERQEDCWRNVCMLQNSGCSVVYLDCRSARNPASEAWLKSSNVSSICDPTSGLYKYGIYADAVTSSITSADFLDKYIYCLWWGLRNLGSLGQNLFTSTNVGEILFTISISIIGLLLVGLLIGNMQRFLQSTSIRREEWRVWMTDTEEWMRLRHLPRELKQRVRRHGQHRWIATGGVDEEAIFRDLPLDIRREVKRHLCLDIVRQVPLFDLMDERMLDAICERLKPCLCTPGMCLVREGDLVCEMLFIVRGQLESYTTDGGRSGFFNSCFIGAGDFCGEELLTWALDPRPSIVLPASTRTVRALSSVDAFVLAAEDLKFVASQFRRMNSKQFRHAFRLLSHQWRAWAARFIQAAWFRYKKRKQAVELMRRLSQAGAAGHGMEQKSLSLPVISSAYTSYLPRLAASSNLHRNKQIATDILNSIQKPDEPSYN